MMAVCGQALQDLFALTWTQVTVDEIRRCGVFVKAQFVAYVESFVAYVESFVTYVKSFVAYVEWSYVHRALSPDSYRTEPN